MDYSFVQLFHPVCFQLKRAEITYRNYIDRGQSFLYASVLYDCNCKIREQVFLNTHLIPAHLENDFLNLIEYLDIWISLWQDYREKLKPELQDRFVFENEFSFPRESSLKIENYLEHLRNTI